MIIIFLLNLWSDKQQDPKQMEVYCMTNACEVVYEHSDLPIDKLISSENSVYIYSLGAKVDPVLSTTEIKFGAIGDVILYDPQYYPLDSNGMYDFDLMFEPVRERIKQYDVAMFVQESIAAGCIETYPTFCSPFEVSDYMQDEMGMDIVSVANNHILDQGMDGVFNALNYYEEIDFDYIGAKLEAEQKPLIVDYDGIKIGYLSYATTYNGFSPPEEYAFMFKEYSEELLLSEIEYLKTSDVDAIISYIHWGDEYTYSSNETQKLIAKQMASGGVNVIVGSHPHVLQEVSEITNDDGSTTLVAYSLGNFTAAQQTYVAETAYAGFLEFSLVFNMSDGAVVDVTYDQVNFFPTYNSSYHEGLITYPLAESSQASKLDYWCDLVIDSENVTCSN
ncbi:CapA family protein [Mollicutes bacterium LVI A0039]|nr:CapA family protein [Mollicutes bacterium LVI A0039]